MSEEKAPISEILESIHEFFICLSDTEELYRYVQPGTKILEGDEEKEGIYVPAETAIKHLIEHCALLPKEKITNNLCNEVLGHLKRENYRPRETFDETNPHLVLQNCLFNIKSMEKEDFTFTYHALAKLPVEYNPNSDYHFSKFWEFLNQILPPEDVVTVQEELACCLRQEYLTKRFAIWIGPPNTGKTTLVSVFEALLGRENVSNVSMQELAAKEPFALACLYGKMANIRDDLPVDVVRSIGKLKEVTGRSTISARNLFHSFFSYVNHAFLIFTCNELPPVEEDDLAFFDRLQITDFMKPFGGNLNPDTHLLEKLTRPEELSAVLNFGLEGVQRMEKQSWAFSNVKAVEEKRESYKRKSNPIWGFVTDCLIVDSEGFIIKERLYEEFKTWCSENKAPLCSRDSFYKGLPKEVTVFSQYREDIDGKRKHCFTGIRLADKEVEEVKENETLLH